MDHRSTSAPGTALGCAAIKKCRLCGRDDPGLETLLDLGPFASCGYFPTVDGPAAPVAPLAVARCPSCGLIQLGHDYDLDSLFRETYGYRSGLNQGMVAHLKAIVASVTAAAGLKSGDIVLDVGANDGTLLGHYDVAGLVRIGIDPTIDQWTQYYPEDILRLADFFTAANWRRVAGDTKAKVITSIAMLYDLPDPNAFVADIAQALAPDGLWIMEQSYLPAMMAANAFDTICHEHLEYYGLLQIDWLVRRHGLRVVDVRFNDVNGGSFQVHVCHADGPYPTNAVVVEETLAAERAQGLDRSADAFNAFVARCRAEAKRLVDFLAECKAEGRRVMGYGASTKGNTLLQFCGVTPELMEAIAECNEVKWGRLTPGSGIPIISEEAARAAKPDFLVALPWHFRASFIGRERAFLERGGRFVFPFPNFEIVAGDSPR